MHDQQRHITTVPALPLARSKVIGLQDPVRGHSAATTGGHSRGSAALKTGFSASSSLFPYLSSTRTSASRYKEHLDPNIHTNKSIQKLPPKPYITDETTSPSHLVLIIIRMAKTSDQVIALSSTSLMRPLTYLSSHRPPSKKRISSALKRRSAARRSKQSVSRS